MIDAAMENDTLLEINNNSLTKGCWRKNTEKNIRRILELCAEYRYPVIIGSDAHCEKNVGRNEETLELLKRVDFPKELVLNYYPEKLKQFLNHYRNTGL